MISVLESESSIDIEWFETSKMIVNPRKFQSIIIDKKQQNHTKETFEIEDKLTGKTRIALLVTVEYAKTSQLKCSKNIQKLFESTYSL